MAMALATVAYPTFNYDLFWHLANGREMWSLGQIVDQDLFSFTHHGTAYTNYEWLSQIILFAIWKVGGVAGLFVFKMVVTVLVVLLCLGTLKSFRLSPWQASVWVALGVLCGFYRYFERPELFSLLGVASMLALVFRTRHGAWPSQWLYVLPLLCTVWEWLHSAVFGVLLFGAVVVGENLLARFGSLDKDTHRTLWRKRLNRAAWVTLALSLLNPYGVLSYDVLMPVVAKTTDYAVVSEWQVPDFRNYGVFYVLFAVGLGAMVKVRPWHHPVEFLWFIGFGLLTWRYSRGVGVFGLAALPWLALAVRDVQNVRWRRVVLVVAMSVLMVGFYIQKISPWSFEERRFGWGVMEKFLPSGSVRFARDQSLQGPMYNTGHFGGYLAFYLYPEHKIFHYNLPNVWGDSYRMDPALPNRHEIEWAILGRPEEMTGMFPPHRWAFLFMDGASVLVARRAGRNAALIRRFEMTAFRPHMPPQALATGLTRLNGGERLAFEAAVHCAYRKNRALCPVVKDHLLSHTSSYPWADDWLARMEARVPLE